MNDKNISIIIAAYNAENTIEKAVDSITKSDLTNYEIIIVNDCSTDNTLKVLQRISKKNSNIVVINNDKNIGAGLSRNKAIDIAKGKYIGFVDADDYVENNYFLNMLESAEKFKSDVVVSDIVLVNNNVEDYGNIYKNNVFGKKYNNPIITKELLLGNWACASSCSKIFKKDILNNHRFSQKKSDDILFTIPAILTANKISYVQNNKYYYIQTDNSLTRNTSYEKYIESLECLIEITKILYKEKIIFAQVYAANALISSICYSLDELKYQNIESYLKVVKDFFSQKNLANELIKINPFLKNNNLFNSKYYRQICNEIVNSNFEGIYNQIYNRENTFDTNLNYSNDSGFKPLVTIVIPVYNGENFIAEAIDSALAQTYDNIEILVVNDGSNDNTEKIVKSYGSKVRYVKKKNGGVASALNLAIKEMKGEYFSWLSHDDLYFENKIKTQIDFLSNLKDKNTVLFSDYILINENGRMINNPVKINHKFTLSKEYCLLRGCVNGITLLIPKVAFDKCGNFNEELRCTQDYDMWLRMLKEYPFVHMKDILSKTRIHSLQDTVISPKAVSEGEKLWQKMINSVSDQRKIELEGSIYNFYYKMAVHLSVSAYPETLQMCIDKCNEINPKRYSKKPAFNNGQRSIYQKIIYCFDNYGLFGTAKVILKKLMRR